MSEGISLKEENEPLENIEVVIDDKLPNIVDINNELKNNDDKKEIENKKLNELPNIVNINEELKNNDDKKDENVTNDKLENNDNKEEIENKKLNELPNIVNISEELKNNDDKKDENVANDKLKNNSNKDENNINNNDIEINKLVNITNIDNELYNLKKLLNSNNIDILKIKKIIESLLMYSNKQKYNYLNDLLNPEICKCVKIPSTIPLPSCSFQLHNSVTLSTNNKGNMAFMFNPFFLCNINKNEIISEFDEGSMHYKWYIEKCSSLWFTNSPALDGITPVAYWIPIDIGQTIPNVYDQYRLVSASIVIKYIGRMDIASGVIGGSIIYDDSNNAIGSWLEGRITIPSVDPDLENIVNGFTVTDKLIKYGNFDLAMDSFYHQENLCLEGLRMLYFPLDNSYEEYLKTDCTNNVKFTHRVSVTAPNDQSSGSYVSLSEPYYKNGFNFFVYALNAPVSSPCFKLDIYCNFECLPNAQFLNYLPLSISPYVISDERRHECSLLIQKKSIMKFKKK